MTDLGQSVDRAKLTPDVHRPRRDDDVHRWIKRHRDAIEVYDVPTEHLANAIDALATRYAECADYGLTLRPEDDEAGDP